MSSTPDHPEHHRTPPRRTRGTASRRRALAEEELADLSPAARNALKRAQRLRTAPAAAPAVSEPVETEPVQAEPTREKPADTVAAEPVKEPVPEEPAEKPVQAPLAPEVEEPVVAAEPAEPARPHAASRTVAARVDYVEKHPPLRGRKRMWAKAGYSVALVGILATAIGLGAYEATADRWPSRATEIPAGHGPAVEWNPQDAYNQISPSLVTDVEVVNNEQGLTVTGLGTEAAAAQPELLAGQLVDLTQNSCAANTEVIMPDNTKVNVWGFCFESLAQDQLTQQLSYAFDSGAQAINFTNHPTSGSPFAVTLTWMPTTQEEYDAILRSWSQVSTEAPLNWVALVIYGAGEMEGYMDYGDYRLFGEQLGLALGPNSTNSRAEEIGLYVDTLQENQGMPPS